MRAGPSHEWNLCSQHNTEVEKYWPHLTDEELRHGADWVIYLRLHRKHAVEEGVESRSLESSSSALSLSTRPEVLKPIWLGLLCVCSYLCGPSRADSQRPLYLLKKKKKKSAQFAPPLTHSHATHSPYLGRCTLWFENYCTWLTFPPLPGSFIAFWLHL